MKKEELVAHLKDSGFEPHGPLYVRTDTDTIASVWILSENTAEFRILEVGSSHFIENETADFARIAECVTNYI